MFIPTSPEFVALCRAQVALLTQGLGASLSVVYLTQELMEGSETRLVPVVAYPETAATWQAESPLALPPAAIAQTPPLPRLLTDSITAVAPEDSRAASGLAHDSAISALPSDRVEPGQRGALVPQRQLMLPLVHEAVVMGLLVTERNDRAWNEWEQSQIRQVADTLALACVLDQRYQWLDRDRRQQRLIQAQQHDILDNLLHQFRNSLTALQTFSKLILKRLLPGDANREIAASIIREAVRLKELSQQLESAVTDTDTATHPLRSLPPAADSQENESSASEEDSLSPPKPIPLLPAGVLAGSPLVLEPCSVEEVLQPLLASAGAIAQERNLTIQIHLLPDLPQVKANVQALREVFNNLIENALKYTPPGGQIEIQACHLVAENASQDSWLQVSVSDTGPGIGPKDLPHIFERRFRGVQAQGNIPGSGLGLAIARALVEQMHGKIQVFSPAHPFQREKRLSSQPKTNQPGTTFVVQLPVAREA